MCDTTTIEERTTLTSLPTELITRLCKNVDKCDILSLRATCKDLFHKVEDEFIAQHMTERRHLFTKFSLETLIKITEKPALVRKLRSLTIVTAETEPERWPIKPPSRRSSYWKDSKRCYEQDVRVYSNWTAEFESLQGGEDVRLLSQALQNLKRAGITPSLSLGHADEHNFRSRHDENGEPRPFQGRRTFGYCHLEHGLGGHLSDYHYLLFRRTYTEHPLSTRLILRAIAVSECPLTALTLGEDFEAQCDLREFVLDSDLARGLANSLQSLKKFKLTLPWENFEENEYERPLQAFTSAISVAAGLEEVTLTFHPDQYVEEQHIGYIPPFGAAFQHAKLVKLNIEHTKAGDSNDIIPFLHQHRNTLKHLRLDHFDFVYDYNRDLSWPVFWHS
ncbi:hypothetical protein HII31_01310 [Pseudocercospora fuligena]|uniref:F-box domain-containing protein n=1 Tax=Pseudocercospora fuligena TaxID=685502 RepID=A0A8H6VMQ7_9PEZI|nr:hypothetical protein HII31_01310 [Pseudocercospora fuligena]